MMANRSRLAVEVLEVRDVPAAITPIGGPLTAPTPLLAVGADSGGEPHVEVYTGDGRLLYSFYAFDQGFVGGVREATADFNGDGYEDIAVGAGPGADPHVAVWDGRTGAQLQSFDAFDAGFVGGVFLGVGDVNADGVKDLIVGAGPGGPPHVEVYAGAPAAAGGTAGAGALGTQILSFIAGDPSLHGGAYVAGGDFNGDGASDIVVGTGRFNPEFINVYDSKSLQLIRSFGGYSTQRVSDIDFGKLGGPALASAIISQAPLYGKVVEGIYFGGEAADLDGDGKLDLATGRVLGDPEVRLFGTRKDGGSGDTSIQPFGDSGDDQNIYGARPVAKDLNGDGVAELIVGAGSGGSAVKVYDARTGQVIRQLNPFPGYTGGVTVG